MARADTETLLSLDEWANVLQINPYEFNAAIGGLPSIALRGCDSVFFPYSYQQDFMSWESIAQAISQAESMVAERVGYYFAPKQFENELVPYPQGAQSAFQRGMSHTPSLLFKPVRLEWAKICNVGTYSETEIESDVAVTFDDNNGDGIPDTFSITVTVDENTDPESFVVYIPQSLRTYPTERTQKWEVRPVRVDISGTTATITGHAALLAKPELQEVYDVSGVSIDLSDSNDRVELLDVYQRTIDTSNAITAFWNSDFALKSTASANATLSSGSASADLDMGYIRPRIDMSTYYGRGAPQTLRVSYVAGVTRKNGKMRPEFARIITYLSVALLNQEKCGCERSDRIIRHWRMYPNSDENDNRPMTPQEVNDNPFGARNGARFAWREVQRLILEGGAYV